MPYVQPNNQERFKVLDDIAVSGVSSQELWSFINKHGDSISTAIL